MTETYPDSEDASSSRPDRPDESSDSVNLRRGSSLSYSERETEQRKIINQMRLTSLADIEVLKRVVASYARDLRSAKNDPLRLLSEQLLPMEEELVKFETTYMATKPGEKISGKYWEEFTALGGIRDKIADDYVHTSHPAGYETRIRDASSIIQASHNIRLLSEAVETYTDGPLLKAARDALKSTQAIRKLQRDISDLSSRSKRASANYQRQHQVWTGDTKRFKDLLPPPKGDAE